MKYLLMFLLLCTGCSSLPVCDEQSPEDLELEKIITDDMENRGNEREPSCISQEELQEREELYEKLMRRSHIYRHHRGGF